MSKREPKPGYKFCTGKWGCGEEKLLEDFKKDKGGKFGRHSCCKQCDKKYREQNKAKITEGNKLYYEQNKTKLAECYKEYREKNKAKIAEYQKEYREKNKAELAKCNKEYREKNKAELAKCNKEYREKNKAELAARKRKYDARPALYTTYSSQLQGIEDTLRDKDGLLICFCKYCGFPCSPTNKEVRSRLKRINGPVNRGQCNLYCSNECKAECPSFNMHWYSRDQKVGTSREVPAAFRKIALEDRNWTCEKCGSTEPGLHVHHIEGVMEQPMFAADLDNAVVVCKECHGKIHSQPGCTFKDFQCAGRDPEFCEATTL